MNGGSVYKTIHNSMIRISDIQFNSFEMCNIRREEHVTAALQTIERHATQQLAASSKMVGSRGPRAPVACRRRGSKRSLFGRRNRT